MLSSIPLKILLAIALGAIIGLEREANKKDIQSIQDSEKNNIGGLRTFSLIGLLGGLVGFLALSPYSNIAIIVSLIFFTLICIYYVIGSLAIHSIGLTTEVAAIFTFLIGFFTTTEALPLQVIISVTIVLTLILSLKEKAKSFILGVSRMEINAFLLFAIVALVVLPFLPNFYYRLSDLTFLSSIFSAYNINLGSFASLEIINPFRLWLIVTLITGIQLLGHIFSRLFGAKKGWLLASVAGGFVSSTSTTISLAQKSKKSIFINRLVSAGIFASLASFFQIIIFVAPLNGSWLIHITPFLISIIFSSFILGIVFLKKDNQIDLQENNVILPDKKEEKIFLLAPALKFASVFVIVSLITKTSFIAFGQSGFLISSVLASITGLDAIIINLAETAGKVIPFDIALLTLVCVNATNLIGKSVFAFFEGDRKFALKLFISMIIISLFGFGAYFLF